MHSWWKCVSVLEFSCVRAERFLSCANRLREAEIRNLKEHLHTFLLSRIQHTSHESAKKALHWCVFGFHFCFPFPFHFHFAATEHTPPRYYFTICRPTGCCSATFSRGNAMSADLANAYMTVKNWMQYY